MFKSESKPRLLRGLRSLISVPEIFRCVSLFKLANASKCVTLVFDKSSSINSAKFERASISSIDAPKQIRSLRVLVYLRGSREVTDVPEQLNTTSLFKFLVGVRSSINVFEIFISTNSDNSLIGSRSLIVRLFDKSIFLILLNAFKKSVNC